MFDPTHSIETPDLDGEPPAPDRSDGSLRAAGTAATAALGAVLAACGGGGGEAAATDTPNATRLSSALGGADSVRVVPTAAQASRFLSQAGFGATSHEMELVQKLGYSGWLDHQMALPQSLSRVDWLRSKGLDAPDYRNSQAGASSMLWRKLITSPDALRQRVALALSEILVVNVSGLSGGFKAFSAASFMDILENNAFGSYRTLLEQVSTSPAMGTYLTYRGNRKATGLSLPDENYARELMQLFTIGLIKLNADGPPLLDQGAIPETDDQPTGSQRASGMTGWEFDPATPVDSADRVTRPMVQIPGRHELGSKDLSKALGLFIPAGTAGVRSLQLVLDALVNHPNTGPFIGRQLIQRLVTSNPGKEYVGRVAAAFADNGAGQRGDLRAAVRAVLLDPDARSDAGLADPAFGKLREPIVRFVQWARTFGLTSPDDTWNIGDTSDPATRLGQSPLRSPSVFNFFRPGYVPPNSPIGERTVPEFQITTESSVAGYVNFMQQAVNARLVGAGAQLDYSELMVVVTDSAALVGKLNLLLAAGQLSADTLASLKTALDSIAVNNALGRNNRLHAALTLVLAAPEYITQK